MKYLSIGYLVSGNCETYLVLAPLAQHWWYPNPRKQTGRPDTRQISQLLMASLPKCVVEMSQRLHTLTLFGGNYQPRNVLLSSYIRDLVVYQCWFLALTGFLAIDGYKKQWGNQTARITWKFYYVNSSRAPQVTAGHPGPSPALHVAMNILRRKTSSNPTCSSVGEMLAYPMVGIIICFGNVLINGHILSSLVSFFLFLSFLIWWSDMSQSQTHSSVCVFIGFTSLHHRVQLNQQFRIATGSCANGVSLPIMSGFFIESGCPTLAVRVFKPCSRILVPLILPSITAINYLWKTSSINNLWKTSHDHRTFQGLMPYIFTTFKEATWKHGQETRLDEQTCLSFSGRNKKCIIFVIVLLSLGPRNLISI